MRRTIATAALAVGLLLAAAPGASAVREEGIETCVVTGCDGAVVPARGVITGAANALEGACGPVGGVYLAPAKVCFVESRGSCEANVTLAGLDGVAAVGARSVGCPDGSDRLFVYVLH